MGSGLVLEKKSDECLDPETREFLRETDRVNGMLVGDKGRKTARGLPPPGRFQGTRTVPKYSAGWKESSPPVVFKFGDRLAVAKTLILNSRLSIFLLFTSNLSSGKIATHYSG